MTVQHRRGTLTRVVLVLLLAGGACRAEEKPAPLKFDFGHGEVEAGYVPILPSTNYSPKLGYGLEPGAPVRSVDRGGEDSLRADFLTSTDPFLFSVAVPEGNYRVQVILGDREDVSDTTVKAESRRLMLEQVRTERGQFVTRTFLVNVRSSRITGGGEVRLKERERSALHWDNKLTLSFGGSRPCICAVEITPIEKAVTVYLAGDSTVTDQIKEPWAGWGQMLPRFFKPDQVVIANHAESGESLKSFLAEKRLEKILGTIKKGDYLFIQFAHNDEKDKGAEAGPFTSYKKNLKLFIAEARKRGAIPVLITPMHRRTFDSQGKVVNTHGDYPTAMRQVANEDRVPLLDLQAMSKEFYEALGPDKSKNALVDNTHTNEYGAYEFAKFLASAIQKSDLSLAREVIEKLPARNLDPTKFGQNRP